MPPGVETPMLRSKVPDKRAASAVAGGVAVLLLAACATVKPTPQVPVVVLPAPPAAPAPAPAPGAPPSPAAPATSPVAPGPSPVRTAPPVGRADRQTMLVESVPAGAIIVVDGRPVGRAPVRLEVPITPQGFFRDDLEVRARFVARNETEVSRTATEEFNPRQRVPAVLRFTPDGVQRSIAGPPAGDVEAAAARPARAN